MKTVDVGIPLASRSREAKYPWDLMAVGDSFVTDRPTVGQPPERLRATGFRIAIRKTGDGLRVWRTA